MPSPYRTHRAALLVSACTVKLRTPDEDRAPASQWELQPGGPPNPREENATTEMYNTIPLLPNLPPAANLAVL